MLQIHQEFTNICTNKCYIDTMILYGFLQYMRISPKNLPTNPPITQVVQAAASLMDDLWDDRRLPWISTQGPILRTQVRSLQIQPRCNISSRYSTYIYIYHYMYQKTIKKTYCFLDSIYNIYTIKYQISLNN